MRSLSLVSNAYVSLENETAYALAYHLCCEEGETMPEYGIFIEAQSAAGERTSALRMISTLKEEVISLIQAFAQNYVFPCHLEAILEDFSKGGKTDLCLDYRLRSE